MGIFKSIKNLSAQSLRIYYFSCTRNNEKSVFYLPTIRLYLSFIDQGVSRLVGCSACALSINIGNFFVVSRKNYDYGQSSLLRLLSSYNL